MSLPTSTTEIRLYMLSWSTQRYQASLKAPFPVIEANRWWDEMMIWLSLIAKQPIAGNGGL